jgi:hypothetical protein
MFSGEINIPEMTHPEESEKELVGANVDDGVRDEREEEEEEEERG